MGYRLTRADVKVGCCTFCDEPGRVLLPFRYLAGSPEVLTAPACMTCRTSWRDDQWACSLDTWRHLPTPTRPADAGPR